MLRAVAGARGSQRSSGRTSTHRASPRTLREMQKQSMSRRHHLVLRRPSGATCVRCRHTRADSVPRAACFSRSRCRRQRARHGVVSCRSRARRRRSSVNGLGGSVSSSHHRSERRRRATHRVPGRAEEVERRSGRAGRTWRRASLQAERATRNSFVLKMKTGTSFLLRRDERFDTIEPLF